MSLSVIVPTLNEERALPATLLSICAGAPGCEVVIADGGSSDATREVAASFRSLCPIWVDAPRGRGAQMNAGAALATGDVLLFLHADSLLPPGASGMIERALSQSGVLGGNFLVRFEPRGAVADLFSLCYNVRSRARIFYGDSAIFVRRDVFVALGGYRASRIMEDIELVRRLRRHGRLALVTDGSVTTSTRRFPTDGAGIRMLAVWMLLHCLMYCGASQETIERLYPEVR